MNARYPSVDAITNDVFQSQYFRIGIYLIKAISSLWNACRFAIVIAFFTYTEEQVATGSVSNRRNISKEFDLVAIRIAWQLFFVLNGATF